MTTPHNLSDLPPSCINISTHRRFVRIDDATEESEQCYLTFDGTPEGFRWLARHFESLANSASQHGTASNIVAPWDFENAPIDLKDWDSMDFTCHRQTS